MSKKRYMELLLEQIRNKRAKELVSQITVEEKMSQMLYQSPAIERLGIPAYNWWNGCLLYTSPSPRD